MVISQCVTRTRKECLRGSGAAICGVVPMAGWLCKDYLRQFGVGW